MGLAVIISKSYSYFWGRGSPHFFLVEKSFNVKLVPMGIDNNLTRHTVMMLVCNVG